MSDLTLADGTEVTFDLSKTTMREYRKFTTGNLTPEEDDALMAKCAGLTAEQVGSLDPTEYKRLLRGFVKAVNSPLTDPN